MIKSEPVLLIQGACLNPHSLTPWIPKLSRRNTSLLSEMLNIADKYGIPSGQNIVLPFVTEDWPTSITGWDASEKRIYELFKPIQANNQTSPDTVVLDDLLPDPAELIQFALFHREHFDLGEDFDDHTINYPTFICAAFYHLSRLPPYADMQEEPCLINEDDQDDGVRTARRALLRKTDHHLLATGTDALRQETARIAFEEFPAETKRALKDQGREHRAVMTWWSTVGVPRLLGPVYQRDVLRSLFDLKTALQGSTVDEAVGELVKAKPGDRYAEEGPEEEEERGKYIREETEALFGQTTEGVRKKLGIWLAEERERIWKDLATSFSLGKFYSCHLH